MSINDMTQHVQWWFDFLLGCEIKKKKICVPDARLQMFVSGILLYPFSLMVLFWPDLNAQFATGCSFGAATVPSNHNMVSTVGLRTCKLDKFPQVHSFWLTDWSNLMVFSNCAGKRQIWHHPEFLAVPGIINFALSFGVTEVKLPFPSLCLSGGWGQMKTLSSLLCCFTLV